MIIERIPRIFASLYEKAAVMAGDGYYRQVAEDVVARTKAGKILDLGTGPGYLPIEIAKISGFITVVGIDLSARLIEAAKRNALRAGLEKRIHFQTGNASSLEFPDGSFDMVISTGMLHMLRNPVKVIEEIHRVLKPGGEGWIYDPARISSQISPKEWRASLSLRERLTFKLFQLFARINRPREYHREQVTELVSQTTFRTCEIAEQNGEIRLKLLK
ncbi:MAG: class I SAM-dependent methyltransferase [Desulfobacterales bacterium]|nr:class I SAM-dependent methyltransferase [Desulfobacterales bacterium]